MVYFSIDYCFEVVAVLKLFVAFSLHWPSNHDIIFAVKPDKISALKCYPPFSLHAWVTCRR
jgi:hypothetical protein